LIYYKPSILLLSTWWDPNKSYFSLYIPLPRFWLVISNDHQSKIGCVVFYCHFVGFQSCHCLLQWKVAWLLSHFFFLTFSLINWLCCFLLTWKLQAGKTPYMFCFPFLSSLFGPGCNIAFRMDPRCRRAWLCKRRPQRGLPLHLWELFMQFPKS